MRVLGPHLPVDEIVLAADALDAAAVGISISVFGAGSQTAGEIRQLRDGLRPQTLLWVGGAGAVHLKKLPEGADVISSLEDLENALLKI